MILADGSATSVCIVETPRCGIWTYGLTSTENGPTTPGSCQSHPSVRSRATVQRDHSAAPPASPRPLECMRSMITVRRHLVPVLGQSSPTGGISGDYQWHTRLRVRGDGGRVCRTFQNTQFVCLLQGAAESRDVDGGRAGISYHLRPPAFNGMPVTNCCELSADGMALTRFRAVLS